MESQNSISFIDVSLHQRLVVAAGLRRWFSPRCGNIALKPRLLSRGENFQLHRGCHHGPPGEYRARPIEKDRSARSWAASQSCQGFPTSERSPTPLRSLRYPRALTRKFLSHGRHPYKQTPRKRGSHFSLSLAIRNAYNPPEPSLLFLPEQRPIDLIDQAGAPAR